MICHCGTDHDAELFAPVAKRIDTGRHYAVSVQGWRFVANARELTHVADENSAARLTLADAEDTLARWVESEKRLGWHVAGQAKIVFSVGSKS